MSWQLIFIFLLHLSNKNFILKMKGLHLVNKQCTNHDIFSFVKYIYCSHTPCLFTDSCSVVRICDTSIERCCKFDLCSLVVVARQVSLSTWLSTLLPSKIWMSSPSSHIRNLLLITWFDRYTTPVMSKWSWISWRPGTLTGTSL